MDISSPDIEVAPAWVPWVLGVWVCGSVARGDQDGLSDIDVTVVVSNDTPALPRPAILCPAGSTRRLDVSVYTFDGFRGLVSPPSLFAWHLRLEGKSLLGEDGECSQLLERMQPFSDHVRDAQVLLQVASEARDALADGSMSVVFEMGILATVIRNTALLVSHFDGKPNFSRHAPDGIKEHAIVPLLLRPAAYECLSRARKASEGGAVPPTPPADLRKIAQETCRWVSSCERYFRGVA